MSRALYPIVNGVEHSFCSLLIGLGAVQITNVRAINYRDVTEMSEIHGTNPLPVGRTRGRVRFEGDMEIYNRDWVQKVLPFLCGPFGLRGYSDAIVPMTVAYDEPGDTSITHQDELLGVRFHSADRANSDGVEATIAKVSLSIMLVRHVRGYQALRG